MTAPAQLALAERMSTPARPCHPLHPQSRRDAWLQLTAGHDPSILLGNANPDFTKPVASVQPQFAETDKTEGCRPDDEFSTQNHLSAWGGESKNAGGWQGEMKLEVVPVAPETIHLSRINGQWKMSGPF